MLLPDEQMDDAEHHAGRDHHGPRDFDPVHLDAHEEARKRAANALDAAGNCEAAVEVGGFRSRDLGAKAGTDKVDSKHIGRELGT